MKTLSGANLTNIAGTFHNYAVLVEMPSLSKQWSSKTKAGYETRIMDISPIVQSINPTGGIAEHGDFTVTIQRETPTQFIQDQNADNTPVEVYIQYGTDAKITLIKGRLDRWEIRGGLLLLHCVANLQLMGKALPLQRLTTQVFSSYRIPEQNLGKWVPLTIGRHTKALGLLADHALGGASKKLQFNSLVSSHEPIGALTQATVWLDGLKESLPIQSSITISANNGYLNLGASGVISLLIRSVPVDAGVDNTNVDAPSAGILNAEDAVDEDFATAATATTIAQWTGISDPNDAEAILWGLIRDFPLAEDALVTGLWLLADLDRNPSLVGSEVIQAGIDRVAGTFVSDVTVLSVGQSSFDNLHGGSETGKSLLTTSLRNAIGVDLDGDGTKESLPLNRLANRRLSLRYYETQLQDPEDTKVLTVNEFRLRIEFRVDLLAHPYLAELDGYEDDGSGTYTGTANALIQNPADVVRFLIAKYLGFGTAALTTAKFTTARTALGSYVFAGQVLDLRPAREVLHEIAEEGKLKLYLDLDDQWAVKAFTLPATEDKHLQQMNGDFVTDDGTEGEIQSMTQSPINEVYNQFEVLYDWNPATEAFEGRLAVDETTSGPIGAWLTESQSRYNVTRKLVYEARFIRTVNTAQSKLNQLIYQYADRKRVVHFQTSVNTVDLELGDTVRLTHPDVQCAEDTTVYAGYRAGDPLATITAGYTDPDTSATIKAGAKVELFEGRHRYEVVTVETQPLNGRLFYLGRQIDVSRSPLSEPF